MMDALIFIFLISLVGTWLFAYANATDTEEPMAKTVSDDFFSMEVRTYEITWLNDTKVLTISLGIAKLQTELSTDFGLIMAGAALGSVPIIIIFLIFQKFFTRGITMGAVKG